MQSVSAKIAVVVPCYRVSLHVLDVIGKIGRDVDSIYCVDDACPDGSGDVIERACQDDRVKVLRHERNEGVGGATLTGYRAAVADGADVIVKLDGDGQMDPALLNFFVEPILQGRADYVKGNRFYNLEDPKGMPPMRFVGNAILSFLTKLSSGYWNIFDPTNGYTAIHGAVAGSIVDRPLAKRYFFESDMLFHLYLIRCVVTDVPIQANYNDEKSNLKISRILLPFMLNHVKNAFRRILIQYFLRDFSLASIELIVGVLGMLFGFAYGVQGWAHSIATQQPATAGTVMVAALPILIGMQLLISTINYDIQNVPRLPQHPRLRDRNAVNSQSPDD